MSGKKVFNSFRVLVVVLMAALALSPFSAVKGHGQDHELQFFEGKLVTIVVATKAGGGYDAYARMAAPYIKKYLPKSTVIVKNVPGAGHIIGANEVYRSKPDGLTIGVANYKGLIFAQIANAEGIKFDLNKFSWLANVASEPQVFIVGQKTPYKSIKDMKQATKPIVVSCSGVGSSSYNYYFMVSKVLGINLKVVPGYSGSEGDLAMLRGEVDGQIGSHDNLRPLVESGDARIVLAISKNKVSGMPEVPLISNYITPENKGLVHLMNASAELGRPITTSPNMPPARLKVLREVIEKAFKDPDLLAQSKVTKLPIQFISGEATRQLFSDALNQPPDVIDLVKKLVEQEK